MSRCKTYCFPYGNNEAILVTQSRISLYSYRKLVATYNNEKQALIDSELWDYSENTTKSIIKFLEEFCDFHEVSEEMIKNIIPHTKLN